MPAPRAQPSCEIYETMDTVMEFVPAFPDLYSSDGLRSVAGWGNSRIYCATVMTGCRPPE